MENIRIQDDLYTYVNQKTLDELVIPDDKPTAGGFAKLADGVEKIMMGEFEAMAESKSYPNDYLKRACELYAIAKTSRAYGYIFKTLAALCEVLELKYEIGVKTRHAYRANDKEELKRLADDYLEISRRMKKLHTAFSYQWHKENKPHGFDIQDIRIGGVIARLEAARDRLQDLYDGEIDRIAELEEEQLDFLGREGARRQPETWWAMWHWMTTPNLMAAME